jgi:hypothetical protein
MLCSGALAQVPKLAEIPVGLPAKLQTSFASRRAALSERRSQLVARVGAHNQQCNAVEENSPAYQSCAAEKASLETDKNQYIADVRAFNRDVEAAPSQVVTAGVVDLSNIEGTPIVDPADLKKFSPGPKQQTPAERVVQLRKRVAVIQQALERLSKLQTKTEDRKEWEDVISDASSDAAHTGLKLGVDLLTDYSIARFTKGLKTQDLEIQDAVVKLSGEIDPRKRDLMHGAIKMMNDRREEFKWEIKNLEAVKLEGDQVVDIMETSDWAAKKGKDVEKSLEGVQTLMQIALGEEHVQKWLKIDPVLGKGLKIGSIAVQSTYDATAVLVGAARLKQMNEQDEAYLARVKYLSGRMRSAMEEIKSLEKQMAETATTQ